METKEYYEAFLAVIDYVLSGNKVIPKGKGFELSGDYWLMIFNELRKRRIGDFAPKADMYISYPDGLISLRVEFRNAIKEIEKREEDRLLDNASKYSGIRFAKISLWVSIAALMVAAGSLAWQIIVSI